MDWSFRCQWASVQNQQGIKKIFPSLYVPIDQTLMKHQLPNIFKKLCKNIYSTNKENIDNDI